MDIITGGNFEELLVRLDSGGKVMEKYYSRKEARRAFIRAGIKQDYKLAANGILLSSNNRAAIMLP